MVGEGLASILVAGAVAVSRDEMPVVEPVLAVGAEDTDVLGDFVLIVLGLLHPIRSTNSAIETMHTQRIFENRFS